MTATDSKKRDGFPAFVRQRRDRLGISQSVLAERSTLSLSLISKLEAGTLVTANLSISNAEKLAKALDVPPAVLINRILRNSDERYIFEEDDVHNATTDRALDEWNQRAKYDEQREIQAARIKRWTGFPPGVKHEDIMARIAHLEDEARMRGGVLMTLFHHAAFAAADQKHHTIEDAADLMSALLDDLCFSPVTRTDLLPLTEAALVLIDGVVSLRRAGRPTNLVSIVVECARIGALVRKGLK